MMANVPGTNIVEEYDSAEAHRRALADKNKSAEFNKLSFQTIFAANGGGALALLSFLTAIITSDRSDFLIRNTDVIFYFSLSSMFFMLGLLAVPASTLVFFTSFIFLWWRVGNQI